MGLEHEEERDEIFFKNDAWIRRAVALENAKKSLPPEVLKGLLDGEDIETFKARNKTMDEMRYRSHADYACNLCPFRSASKLNLQAHESLVHSDNRGKMSRGSNGSGISSSGTKYACSECQFESPQKSCLLAHMHASHVMCHIPK